MGSATCPVVCVGLSAALGKGSDFWSAETSAVGGGRPPWEEVGGRTSWERPGVVGARDRWWCSAWWSVNDALSCRKSLHEAVVSAKARAVAKESHPCSGDATSSRQRRGRSPL